MEADQSLAIFSPVGVPRPTGEDKAGESKALDSIAGKRIGLLDDGVTGPFFHRLESLLMTKWEVGSVGHHKKDQMTAPAPE